MRLRHLIFTLTFFFVVQCFAEGIIAVKGTSQPAIVTYAFCESSAGHFVCQPNTQVTIQPNSFTKISNLPSIPYTANSFYSGIMKIISVEERESLTNKILGSGRFDKSNQWCAPSYYAYNAMQKPAALLQKISNDVIICSQSNY